MTPDGRTVYVASRAARGHTPSTSPPGRRADRSSVPEPSALAVTWTCYINNDLNGGDPFPATSYVASLLETRAVISTHQPVTAACDASTQFELIGPDGEPPLMYQRTIAAHAEDGAVLARIRGTATVRAPRAVAARLTRARLDRALRPNTSPR